MEKTIVPKIMKHLESLGFFCIKIHGGVFQIAGLPDILAIRAGAAYWIEVKQPGKQPTKIQVFMINKLRRFGCRAGVATSIQEALDIVNYGADPKEKTP